MRLRNGVGVIFGRRKESDKVENRQTDVAWTF